MNASPHQDRYRSIPLWIVSVAAAVSLVLSPFWTGLLIGELTPVCETVPRLESDSSCFPDHRPLVLAALFVFAAAAAATVGGSPVNATSDVRRHAVSDRTDTPRVAVHPKLRECTGEYALQCRSRPPSQSSLLGWDVHSIAASALSGSKTSASMPGIRVSPTPTRFSTQSWWATKATREKRFQSPSFENE